MDKSERTIAIRRRSRQLKRGTRYVLVGPSGGAMRVTLFGVLRNSHARYFVLRYDGRGRSE